MTRIVTILLLTWVLMLAGCETATTTESSEQEAVVQSQRAELLAQIDRTYESPEAHYKLGKLYHQEGQLDKADFEYRVAIGFDPVHYRAQAGVVRVMVDRKQAERGQVVAEIYISQTAVSAEKSLLLGKAFENEDLGEFALSCYYQAAGLEPKSPEPFRHLGFYYVAQDDKLRAEENLRRSFELDPYQADVSGELGRMGVIVGLPRSNVAPPAEPQQ